MNSPEWKAFEKDIHAIHAQFATKGTKVQHDVKLWGSQSRTQRQIDVAIRAPISGYSMLVVIECKDKKRPIDVNDVSEFAVKVKDIEANKGVIVSRSGYTSAAIAMRRSYGLDVLTFGEVSEEQRGGLATFCITATLGEAEWRLLSLKLGPDEAQRNLVLEPNLMLYDRSGFELGTINSNADRQFAEGRVPKNPGVHILDFGVVFLMVEKVLRQIQLLIEVSVNLRNFIGNFPLLRTRIIDAGTLKVVQNLLRTPPMSMRPWEGSQPEWVEVDSLDGLATTAAGHLFHGPDWLGPRNRPL